MISETEIRNMYDEKPTLDSISAISFEEVYLDGKNYWGQFPCFTISDQFNNDIWTLCEK